MTEVYEKYSHDGNLSSYVQTATQEVFKAVTARYSAPDLISQRAAVSSDITSALRTKLATYGAQVISIDMRNFSFSESYMRAINDKVTQEQLRLAEEYIKQFGLLAKSGTSMIGKPETLGVWTPSLASATRTSCAPCTSASCRAHWRRCGRR